MALENVQKLHRVSNRFGIEKVDVPVVQLTWKGFCPSPRS